MPENTDLSTAWAFELKPPPRYTEPKEQEITETVSKTRSLRSQTEGTQLNESLKALERFHQLFGTDKKGSRG